MENDWLGGNFIWNNSVFGGISDESQQKFWYFKCFLNDITINIF